jgi:hypothetical protein
MSSACDVESEKVTDAVFLKNAKGAVKEAHSEDIYLLASE